MRLPLKIPTDRHLRQALIGAVVTLATKLSTAALGFGVTILIARQFGATGSGVWALALTLLMIAGNVSLCGLDYGSTRTISVHHLNKEWSIIRSWTFTSLLIIGVVGAITSSILWLAAGPLARAFDEGAEFAHALQILCIAVIPYSLLRLLGGLLRGMRRFALAELLEGLFIPSALVLVALTIGFRDLEAVADTYVAGACFGAVIGLSVWFAFIGTKGRPATPLMPRDALEKSLPLAGSVLVLLASPWLMTILVAKFATAAEVGVLRVVLQFTVLLGFLLTAVETSLSPQIAALHSQHKLKELLNSTKKMTALMVLLGGTPALLLIIFAEPLLGLLGPEFPQGATAMRILLIGQMVNLATGPVGSFMAMTGLGRQSFKNALVGTSLVLVICLTLAPLLGVTGAAIAGAASAIYRNLALSVIIWRRHGLILPLGIAKKNPALHQDVPLSPERAFEAAEEAPAK
jgi:O-antigen/teichoic acid export membrane protein